MARFLSAALAVIVGVLLAFSLTGAPASATANAASVAVPVMALDIGPIGYNAYGTDTSANRNSEYVDIRNVTGAPVAVAGLLVQDAWARGNNRTTRCNTYTLAPGALPVTEGATADMLPAGATLRVHMGSGTPKVRGTVHSVFRDMPPTCGYNGHVFNNGPSSNKWAPWDTAWITLGDQAESKSYNYSFGYVAK